MTKIYRPSLVEVDLSVIGHNYRQVEKIVGPKVKILAAVKAHAYGHGLIEISRFLEKLGVEFLGVASIDEGIELRENGIGCKILVLGSVLRDNCQDAIENNLTLTVCTRDLLWQLDKLGREMHKAIPVQLKIDTGMGRIGMWHKEAVDFIQEAASFANIKLEGLYTHFPSAETDPEFTREQLKIFNSIVEELKPGIKFDYLHSANSMGILGYKDSHFNLVRPGLILYGIYPDEKIRNLFSFKPALTLKSKVVFLKKVPEGRGISYGHTYKTSSSVNIATVAIGYADGYPRALSNCSEVLIKGKRHKVIGAVCMDKIMVEIKDDAVELEDEVVLIGKQKDEIIRVEELAQHAGTIAYEIITGLSSRLPRIYKSVG